jgi:hypothetical protein
MKKTLLTSMSIALLAITTFAQNNLINWGGGNTALNTYPRAGTTTTNRMTNAQESFGGIGINVHFDGRNVFSVVNTSTTLNTATAPYLQYKVTVTDSINLDRFVFAGLAVVGSASIDIRSSIDNYSTTIDSKLNLNSGSYHLTSLNLSSLPNIANSVITFRIYFYNVTPNATGNIFLSDSYNSPSIDGTPVSYGQVYESVGIWGVPVCIGNATSSTSTVYGCTNNLPYTWNNVSFMNDTTQIVHLLNVNGCDSAATINFIVKNPSTTTFYDTVCSSALPYSYNGYDYYTTGVYNNNYFTSYFGCDSIVTLRLYVKESSTTTLYKTVCSANLPYSLAGLVTFYGSGTQSFTVANSVGCDSVVTVVVTVSYPNLTNVSANKPILCAGDTAQLMTTTQNDTLKNYTFFDENFNYNLQGWTATNLLTPAGANDSWKLYNNNYFDAQINRFYTNIDASNFYMSSNTTTWDTGNGQTHTQLLSPIISTKNISNITLEIEEAMWADGTLSQLSMSTDSLNWVDVLVENGFGSGSPDVFITKFINVPAQFDNKDTVYLRFNYTASYDGFWAINNLKLRGDKIINVSSYAWTPALSLSTPLMANTLASPSKTTNYAITTTNSVGCITTGNIVVKVSKPTVAINYSTPAPIECDGTTDTLTAIGNALSYVWSTNQTNNTIVVSHMLGGDTSYTVTATDSVGCTNKASYAFSSIAPFATSYTIVGGIADSLCVTDSTKVLNFGNVNGNWSGTGIVGNTFNPTIAGVGTHTITYTETYACGSSTIEGNVRVDACLVGVLNKSKIANVTIAPNPNNGTFTITTPTFATYTIVNELGQSLHTFTTNASASTVTISNLNTGVYFIKNNANATHQKIVVTQ